MKETIALIPLWMLLMAAFGFIVGLTLGDELRRRRVLKNASMNCVNNWNLLMATSASSKKMRSVLNDLHRRIHRVTKSLEKQPS